MRVLNQTGVTRDIADCINVTQFEIVEFENKPILLASEAHSDYLAFKAFLINDIDEIQYLGRWHDDIAIDFAGEGDEENLFDQLRHFAVLQREEKLRVIMVKQLTLEGEFADLPDHKFTKPDCKSILLSEFLSEAIKYE